MYFKKKFKKRDIENQLRVSRNFVTMWTKSSNQDFTKDIRGWPKGKPRKYTKADKTRIKKIRDELTKDSSDDFYCGATVILQEYRKRYPNLKPPTLRFIGRVLAKSGLAEQQKKHKNKGAAPYLHYPEYSVYHLGKRVLEIDFIGHKFIRGRTEPINFIGFSFKKEPKLRHFKRISGETGDNLIRESRKFFKKFEKPEAVKMDNDFAMAGSSPWPRTISKVALNYLKEQIIPIYSVPRRPFSQASIEGNNSVFSRKFWNRFDFKNIQEIDEKLELFNLASQRYSEYQSPKEKPKKKQKFIPKVYFIRQVSEDERTGKGYIALANDKVFIRKSYINYFVLAEWNFKKEQLYVYFEDQQKLKRIKKIKFKINQKSKEKLPHFI
jgi:hypothetical protein